MNFSGELNESDPRHLRENTRKYLNKIHRVIYETYVAIIIKYKKLQA